VLECLYNIKKGKFIIIYNYNLEDNVKRAKKLDSAVQLKLNNKMLTPTCDKSNKNIRKTGIL